MNHGITKQYFLMLQKKLKVYSEDNKNKRV